VITIMGSNMAENHPVGFQWVMEAQRRGATVIHVDPRFTRTSAVADVHVPIRAGTDIAFLGGLINRVLTTDSDFREYVVPYTNASTIISDDYVDAEELGGLFSGWKPDTAKYDDESWSYRGSAGEAASQEGDEEGAETETSERSGALGGQEGAPSPDDDDRHCNTRTVCSRSCAGTSLGTPRRWLPPRAESPSTCSSVSPTR
jgi:formate dehydrogenase major subunit